MSQHKTGNSNFDRAAYWERHNQGESGTEAPVLERAVDLSKEINEETGKPKYLTHFGPNRRARRQKIIDRSATKKGMSQVIHVDENRQARKLFVPKGGKPYNLAMTASRRIQKAAARGE